MGRKKERVTDIADYSDNNRINPKIHWQPGERPVSDIFDYTKETEQPEPHYKRINIEGIGNNELDLISRLEMSFEEDKLKKMLQRGCIIDYSITDPICLLEEDEKPFKCPLFDNGCKSFMEQSPNTEPPCHALYLRTQFIKKIMESLILDFYTNNDKP